MAAKKEKIICSECGSRNIIKKGLRKNKRADIQKYRCKDCCHWFSLGRLKHKTYDVGCILESLGLYNKGYSFEEVSKQVNKKYKLNVSGRTINNWFREHKELCSFSRFRIRNKFLPNDVMFRKRFFHKQPYIFKYHKFKIEELVNDYFKGLREFVVDAAENCPDELFVSSNARASQFRLSEDAVKRIKLSKSKTKACKLASLALNASESNKERHTLVQDFMLANDSATLAVEVPVWLLASEISDDNIVSSVLNGVNQNITGHIDIVQNKFGFIYVLDYKPKADYENAGKVISQLFVYALALSVRTGVWLRNFRCAWFDEESYFEFNPNLVFIDSLKRKGIKDNDIWRKYWSDYKKHNKVVKRGWKERLIGVWSKKN